MTDKEKIARSIIHENRNMAPRDVVHAMRDAGISAWYVGRAPIFLYDIDGKLCTVNDDDLDDVYDMSYTFRTSRMSAINSKTEDKMGDVIFFDDDNNITNIVKNCSIINFSRNCDRYVEIIKLPTYDARALLDGYGELVSGEWYDKIHAIGKRYAMVVSNGMFNIINLGSHSPVSDVWYSFIDSSLLCHGFVGVYKNKRRMLGTLLNLCDGSLVNGWYDALFIYNDEDPDKTILKFNCETGTKTLTMTLIEFLEFAENN